MWGPLLANMLLTDTSGFAYREADYICPRPVRTAKPCHEMMQGTAEAVFSVLLSGMLFSTGSGTPILLPHALNISSRRSLCSAALKASSIAPPLPFPPELPTYLPPRPPCASPSP